MTYALIIVEKPKAQSGWPERLRYYTQEMPNDAGVERIAEGVWLLDLDTELLVLAHLVMGAHEATTPCRALFFDQKPTFAVLAKSK